MFRKLLIVPMLLLSLPIQAKLDVQINDKDCVIKQIQYSGIYSFIAAQGNCKIIYEMCTRDFCEVKKLETTDDYLRGNYGAVQDSTVKE